MKLSKKEIRAIIEDEITIDCYDEYEVNLGWETYLEENIRFPFLAECRIKFKNGKQKWVKVEVVDNESALSNYSGGNYYVEIAYGEIIFPVSLDSLRNIKADEDTMRAVQVWKWKDRF